MDKTRFNDKFFECDYLHLTALTKETYFIKYDGATPLHLAASNGHVKICQLIMEHLSNKNPANFHTIGDFTPFHEAAKNGHLGVCQLMIDNLSDKNPATKSARVTPLHLAAQFGDVALCKLIMENLVDKNPRCSSGTTPLIRATLHLKFEVCEIFHENGIHLKEKELETSLTVMGNTTLRTLIISGLKNFSRISPKF